MWNLYTYRFICLLYLIVIFNVHSRGLLTIYGFNITEELKYFAVSMRLTHFVNC